MGDLVDAYRRRGVICKSDILMKEVVRGSWLTRVGWRSWNWPVDGGEENANRASIGVLEGVRNGLYLT